jgi:aspartyl-tRNA(Asn)/glutamyl-tRNA(Gln) amidotransferase subunit B
MDRGEMRCDVNVSVHRADSDTFGTRCEVKNLNGVRFLMAAIGQSNSIQLVLRR